jgi:hypothetical protein
LTGRGLDTALRLLRYHEVNGRDMWCEAFFVNGEFVRSSYVLVRSDEMPASEQDVDC